MTRVVTEPLSEAALRGLLAELGREAREERFEVAPNPAVGAALLSGASVLARGVHRRWGGPHAEIVAFEAARAAGLDPAAADTLLVTLEPCSSHGKTPPCTDAIAASGVRRVVVGALDPDPRHRARGMRLLGERGLEVALLAGASPLEQVAPHFLSWTDLDRRRRPRPWTIAKWAQTRGGQLVPPEHFGDGRWISGAASLAEVQVLRSRVDAIVTGVGTVLADDPRLTVRAPVQAERPAVRVVLDSYLRTPPGARLFAPERPGEGAGPVVILHMAGQGAPRARALEAAGARLVALHKSAAADNLSLRDVQGWLWQEGARRVLVEAGPRLLRAYLEAGFVDQVRVYTGNVSGGRGESMAETLSQLRLRDRLYRECGDDSVLEGFLETGG